MSPDSQGRDSDRHSRRVALYAASLVLAVAGLFLMAGSQDLAKSVSATASRMERQHGIAIGYGHPTTFFTEPYTSAAPNSNLLHIESAHPDMVSAALSGVEHALLEYPSGFVARLIRAVFIGGTITIEGREAGGVVGRHWIVLAAPPTQTHEETGLKCRAAMHHELSSFVLDLSPGAIVEWAKFAPAGRASTYGRAALAHAESAPPLSSGILSAYGSTNPENDFNTYAEMVFLDPRRMALAARQEALVRAKLAFFMHAYESIDPRMTGIFGQRGLSGFRTTSRPPPEGVEP